MSSTPKQILHDRVNLVRLVRRLEKSVNLSDWGSEQNTLLWLRSEGLLQQLKHARKLLSRVEFYNESQPSAKLRRRLTDIRSLLDKLDSSMLSVNERVVPKPPHVEPLLPTLSFPTSSARKVDLPVAQRLAPPSDITSGPLRESEQTAADVNLLLGSAEEESSQLPLEPALDVADATSAQAFLPHSTALQEELSAQLAQMAGQLRRNAEHFSNALAADQAVLHNAEEKIGANYDVMKRERVRLRDHRVTVAFVVMFFVLRFT
ncbi:hypothetical protein BJV74DRAFT_863904 [Russula compacta]|nr:hypothetical protein BJV74DRAFT_863904 [Russula compacta]